MSLKKEFLVESHGKSFPLYAGLLDLAHQEGLSLIHTELIQIPLDVNGYVAIVQATVTTSKGTFSGIGDASPQNVNRMMVNALLRMGETRAKARALRDAVNVGVAALEELGEDADVITQPASVADVSFSPPFGQQQTTRNAGFYMDEPEAGPADDAPANPGAPSTTRQHQDIFRMVSGRLGYKGNYVVDLIEQRYGVRNRKDLTYGQAEDLLAYLETQLPKA